MPVPTYDQFIEPVLRYLAAHPEGALARDVHEAAAEALALSATDRQEILPSGAQAVYQNRSGWAHDLLHRMGYGASRAALQRVGKAGDGGIDGVISLDRYLE
jgi:restriction system protein